MKKILETERLFLREMNMDDYGALYAVLADSDIMQHYPYTFDEKRVRGWIERNINRYRENGFGLWAVCLKDTGEMIGDCGLSLQNIDGEMLPEIGYHIRSDCQRKGYAKEAAGAVRDWAFQNTNYQTLYSYCKYTNTASIKTAEAIGMNFDKEYPDEANEITHVSVIRRVEFKIPDSVNMLIDGKPYVFDDIGMSGSKIMIFDDCVLKIVNYRKENEDTVQMMKWLEGKIPGPKVICYEKDSAHQYLLMSKVPGKMSCDEYFLEHPQELLALLAKALKMLWSVDISDCPRNRDIDAELQEAKYRIENNLVDLDNVEPTTFGEGGFKNPQALLEWLEENRPDYEPVLSHGDFCLPNIFIEDGKISGFIDLGDTGIGDKWRDIALCYRSLQHNFDGSFGGKVYPDFNPDMLFDALGIEPNREKLRYYILLDELF